MKQILFILLAFCSFTVIGQQTEMTSANRMKYLIYLPDIEAPVSGFPLMLFLHGSGERGDDLDLVKKHGPPSFLDDTTDFPFVVASPQCHEGQTWKPLLLIELLDELSAIAFVDTNRVYVTGLSMGGSGTWDLTMAAPERFAAIVPICGTGDTLRACTIKQVPVWVFHGAGDEIVSHSYSDDMVEALGLCGANVKYTLYPDVDHFAWVPAYNNPKLYEWLLQQERK